MTINQRVKDYIDYKGISFAELGRMIISKRGDVSSWFNEKSIVDIPPKKVLEIIRVYKDLNARWLITGEGEMLESISRDDISFRTAEVNEPKVEYKKDALVMIREISEENGVLKERVRNLESELAQFREEDSRQGPKEPRARAG